MFGKGQRTGSVRILRERSFSFPSLLLALACFPCYPIHTEESGDSTRLPGMETLDRPPLPAPPRKESPCTGNGDVCSVQPGLCKSGED